MDGTVSLHFDNEKLALRRMQIPIILIPHETALFLFI